MNSYDHNNKPFWVCIIFLGKCSRAKGYLWGYGKKSDDLERVLDNIWVERKRFIPSENLYYESSLVKQRFIDFKKNEIGPRNWIGSIHAISNDEEEYAINLLPKIFHKEKHKYTLKETDSIFVHILWWLSGSEKQNYDTMESSLGALESDFLEILVFMFSSYTLEILSVSSYNYYDAVNVELETVKEQIDFNKYVQNYAVVVYLGGRI